MSIAVASPYYELGDQFSYPTYTESVDQHLANVVDGDLFEAPTRPKKIGLPVSRRRSVSTFDHTLWILDETFPSGTRLLNKISDLLPFFDLELGVEGDPKTDCENEIRSFRAFPLNWDGHGAVPPNDEVVDNAVHILRNLPRGLSVPEPSLTIDGTIALDILDSGFRSRCTIEVKPDRRAVFSLTATDGVSAGYFILDGDASMLAALETISNKLG